MRLTVGIALALIATTPALAAPNVFWTFGFDFPRQATRAPHFGQIIDIGRYVDGTYHHGVTLAAGLPPHLADAAVPIQNFTYDAASGPAVRDMLSTKAPTPRGF